MKKILLFWFLLSAFLVVWCTNDEQKWNDEDIYKWELIISGVWPEISFESTIKEWTLALIWYFEDYSDHIFLPAGSWEKYFNKESDYLPWNKVKFKWYVIPLDWAAGNHYYEVESIKTLEVSSYPSATKIEEIFDSYNYCEKDSDCWYFVWECPLGCFITLNVKYIDVASNIVTNFVNHLWDERCIYDCMYMDKAVCNNYKCEMVDSPDEADIHGCWPKDPELSCDDGWYDLVCGNDWKTYWNDCMACQSETVETYTQWECESNTFVIEWDSEYL